MAWRIGVAFVVSGVLLDLALNNIWGFEYVIPGIGIFGTLLFPFAILLLLFSAFTRLQKRWAETFLVKISLTAPELQAGMLQMNSPALRIPQEQYKIHTRSWLLRSAGIAILLCVAGISLHAGFEHWLNTRTLEPLNMPVSLARGDIRTGKFYINLKGWFFINLGVDYQFPEDAKCQFGGRDSILKASLILYRDGQILNQFNEATLGYSYYFYAEQKGNYDLDVQVLTDAGCLNVRHPRIRIYCSQDYSGLQFGIGCLAGILSLAGISLLAHSAVAWIMDTQSAIRTAPAIFQDVDYRISPSHRPLRHRFSSLPSFGVFWATILAIGAVLPMCVLQFALKSIPKGIFISLLKDGFQAPKADHLPAPILIRVKERAGLPPTLYLNSKPVSWEGLHDALQAELARRPDWVVYIRGDENIQFQYVVSVMDTVRELHAKAVLLTPNTQEFVSIR